jgi:pimeloyl-ACP methyl ester carboxylesterase
VKSKPAASSPSCQKRPLLLYLPGMDGTGKLFYRQAQALQAEFRVRPLSLNHPEAGHSWESLADWVGSQLEEGAYLCGESFGACLALAVAAQQPERCRGLILVNPASSLRRRPWWWAGQVLLPFLPPGLYHQLAERGVRVFGGAGPNGAAGSGAAAPGRAQRFSGGGCPSSSLAGILCCGRFAPRVDEAASLAGGGGRDRLLPSVQEVRRLAERLPQAQVEISPLSGHACLLERQMNLRRYLLKPDGSLPRYCSIPLWPPEQQEGAPQVFDSLLAGAVFPLSIQPEGSQACCLGPLIVFAAAVANVPGSGRRDPLGR